MKLVLLTLLIVFIFIVLLFQYALRIRLVFNSDKSDINMTVLWLDPFIRALINIENAIPRLNLYLFNKKILEKTLKTRGNKRRAIGLIKFTTPKDIHVNVYYGFRDPFTTGIACGAMNIASQLINIDLFNQMPDFMTTNDYIYLDATAKVNLGSTLIKFFKSKTGS